MTKEQEVMLSLNPYVYIRAKDLNKELGVGWINNRRYNRETDTWEFEEVSSTGVRLGNWKVHGRTPRCEFTLDKYHGDVYFDPSFKGTHFSICEIKKR